MRVGRRIILEGRVQGLGVRPAIARLAMKHQLSGRVRNRRYGVEVEIHGQDSNIGLFERELLDSLPTDSAVQRQQFEEIPVANDVMFRIEHGDANGTLRTSVPRDVAMCSECQREVSAPANRRCGYALTTCVTCGPRFSVTTAMPFERETTTMSSFALCSDCVREFSDPTDRRFHAQTISCPICGPRVWAADRNGSRVATDRAALQVVVAALRCGEIAALRGIGGYQLLCDATSSAAVARLRDRKRRPSKPLAVMVESLPAARRIADVSDLEARWLAARENPIVLVAARTDSPLATGIHPGFHEVGMLLPSSPLHWEIAREFGRPFVATSGNREGEPLAVDIAEAETQLAGIADVWLHHDRPIAYAVDDSVLRVIANRSVLLRMARGFAPLVLPEWPRSVCSRTPMLAVGGHLKNAIALDNGEQSVLGPHLGDLDNERTRQRFIEHVSRLTRLFGIGWYDLVHDQHPGYFTSEWANQQGRRTIAVQHHHAHVAAVSWEHGWLDREVLGFAWDGTGFGADGSIWGGETLRVCGARFERIGSCRPFRLIGGEAAIREPWRVTAVLLRDAAGDEAAREFVSRMLSQTETTRFLNAAATDRLASRCTSIGRLFDGVACLALGISHSDFEGQAAMWLEQACVPTDGRAYSLAGERQLDWRPMLREILHDLRHDVPRGVIASKFHHTLARFVTETAGAFPDLPLVLAGGAFQNRVLVESIVEQLGSSVHRLGLSGMIPPNDGGLAAGQLAVARMSLQPLEGVR